MKKEIRLVDSQRGVYQITTWDERWYAREERDPGTGLPVVRFLPSCTWICSYVPKGKQFVEWVARVGLDDAEQIKRAAGVRGSKAHAACSALLSGDVVSASSRFLDDRTGTHEQLDGDEAYCVKTFADWYECARTGKTRDKGEKGRVILPSGYDVVGYDMLLWMDADGWAGTGDLELRRHSDGALGVCDIKTSKYLWLEHRVQVSAYRRARSEYAFASLLQIGYAGNERGWFFTEVEDKYHLFKAAKEFWSEDHKDEKPLQRDFPLEIQLADRVIAVA